MIVKNDHHCKTYLVRIEMLKNSPNLLSFLHGVTELFINWKFKKTKKGWPSRDPEVDLRKYVTHMPSPNVNKTTHPGFETQRRCYHKFKTGIPVAPQKGLMSSTIFKKLKCKKNILTYLIYLFYLPAAPQVMDRSLMDPEAEVQHKLRPRGQQEPSKPESPSSLHEMWLNQQTE